MDLFGVLNMICGLALFLYGMHVMGEGLSRMSGGKLESILERLTQSRIRAVLLGAAVTAVIQSSSATTVMVVGFVNSGIMRLSQAAGVIMGANIGTTITSWILSLTGIESSNIVLRLLKPSSFTPVLAIVGVGFLLFTKSEKKHNIGTILIGFTVLMCGMQMMSDAVKPLADVPEFTSILLKFTNPVLGMLAGLLLTAVIQSSSASVGILQALCVTGAVTYGAALPIIMGQNIGTCVTAILSGIGASKNARRAALIHLYFNIIGTVLFMTVFYAINAVFPFAFLTQPANAAGIAVIHTVFNVLATLVLLPFSHGLERLATLTIRDDEQAERIDDFQLLDERFLATPAFAVDQCRVVAARMAELTQEAIFEAIDLIDGGEFSEEKAERIEALETKIDRYEDNLGTYMVKLSRAQLSREDGHTVSVLLHSISDFERISDHAVNLLDSAREMNDKKLTFSPMAASELHVFAQAVRDIVKRSTDCFLRSDVELARTVEPLEACIDELNVTIKSRHIERLTNGQCTIQLGFVLTDISTNFERVSDHCSNIAIYQIQVPKDEYDAHEYLLNIQRQDHEEFDREELRYEQLYRLPQ
ncbi:MAG: Na/Pi cotransporter family protein [Clostridiales bacterium]|nr:Na/Pi cotransporter family protein [Clostridiales bacterium]MDY5515900.1 Na/Pi cotransporter family protein [Candidatus Ventricola sp.]